MSHDTGAAAVVERVQQTKAAYQQARQALVIYGQQHWIGKRGSVDTPGLSFSAQITKITPAGRVHFDLFAQSTFDIEAVAVQGDHP